MQSNSEGGKGATVHSSTTSKSCEQNTVATLNDVGNVRHDVKGEGKNSKSLGKPGKQITIINHKKLVKQEWVTDIGSKISGISTFSEKQNTVKVIESNLKNHHLKVHDSSKLPLHAADICTFQDRLSSKMRDYQKYALIKNFFKPDQYCSYRFTERNFVFSWINTFPWLCYSRIEDGAYCLQCVLFGTTYPGKKLPNFFSKTYRDWRHALTSFRSH